MLFNFSNFFKTQDKLTLKEIHRFMLFITKRQRKLDEIK